jgi:hypothetical protein
MKLRNEPERCLRFRRNEHHATRRSADIGASFPALLQDVLQKENSHVECARAAAAL